MAIAIRSNSQISDPTCPQVPSRRRLPSVKPVRPPPRRHGFSTGSARPSAPDTTAVAPRRPTSIGLSGTFSSTASATRLRDRVCRQSGRSRAMDISNACPDLRRLLDEIATSPCDEHPARIGRLGTVYQTRHHREVQRWQGHLEVGHGVSLGACRGRSALQVRRRRPILSCTAMADAEQAFVAYAKQGEGTEVIDLLLGP